MEKDKIKDLLQSGLEANVELALQLVESQDIDFNFNPYLEIADWALPEYKELPAAFRVAAVMSLESIENDLRVYPEVPYSIALLTNLKSLSLTNKRYFFGLPKSIVGLEHLEELYLHNNMIRRISKSIVSFQNLRKLDLFMNHLSEIPEEIVELVHLKELCLSANRFSKSEQAKIKAMLPNCLVTF